MPRIVLQFTITGRYYLNHTKYLISVHLVICHLVFHIERIFFKRNEMIGNGKQILAILTVLVAISVSVAYQKVNLNVENDDKSPNLIKVIDLTYEHVNNTMLLLSAKIDIVEKIAYGTKVE